MLNNKFSKIYFLPFTLTILFFPSCSLFGPVEIPVSSCNAPTYVNVVDTITHQSGIASLVHIEIDGNEIEKWVLLPDTPSFYIYVPCNMPEEAKVKSKRFDFDGYVYDQSPNWQDPTLNGFSYIELTSMQKD